MRSIVKAHFMETLGKVPLLGGILRSQAQRFDEGSVIEIRSGIGAGLKWRRHHRNANAYWLGSYELGTQLALQRLLRAGDVFYDVGANAGFFTVLAARLVGPSGRVFAFEPVPENVESVREQIELNRLSWCEVVPLAVGAHSGQRTLSYVPGSSAMAHLGPRRLGGELQIQVQAVTLDEFIVHYPFPSLVKLDVEGAEGEVLQGAMETIGRGARFILELHSSELAIEVARLLLRAGYVLELLDGSPAERPAGARHLIAQRPDQRGAQ
jgi:FkbM family methyltransferase